MGETCSRSKRDRLRTIVCKNSVCRKFLHHAPNDTRLRYCGCHSNERCCNFQIFIQKLENMNDTHSTIVKKMYEMIRLKSPEERLQMGCSMNETPRYLVKRHIREQHPHIRWSDCNKGKNLAPINWKVLERN